jgi:hypothetical protein
VVGLDEIMAELHSMGRQANHATADEILNRLGVKNYIPASELTRREYRRLLIKEYEEYMSTRAEKGLG